MMLEIRASSAMTPDVGLYVLDGAGIVDHQRRRLVKRLLHDRSCLFG